MSYILEALKKAQAERQLGNAPTIHAPQPVSVAPPGRGAWGRPLIIGIGGAMLALLLGGWFITQRPPAPAPVAAAPQIAAQPAPATLLVSAPPSPPASPRPPAARMPETPARPASAAPSAAPAPRRSAAPAPSPLPEDGLPMVHQLPDAVQRELPRVSFGGYMYSANPADRLLLVDKTLRHEGEEVAPGLVLEKLLPKAAVMNYRGLRYRAAY